MGKEGQITKTFNKMAFLKMLDFHDDMPALLDTHEWMKEYYSKECCLCIHPNNYFYVVQQDKRPLTGKDLKITEMQRKDLELKSDGWLQISTGILIYDAAGMLLLTLKEREPWLGCFRPGTMTPIYGHAIMADAGGTKEHLENTSLENIIKNAAIRELREEIIMKDSSLIEYIDKHEPNAVIPINQIQGKQIHPIPDHFGTILVYDVSPVFNLTQLEIRSAEPEKHEASIIPFELMAERWHDLDPAIVEAIHIRHIDLRALIMDSVSRSLKDATTVFNIKKELNELCSRYQYKFSDAPPIDDLKKDVAFLESEIGHGVKIHSDFNIENNKIDFTIEDPELYLAGFDSKDTKEDNE